MISALPIIDSLRSEVAQNRRTPQKYDYPREDVLKVNSFARSEFSLT